MVGVTAGNCCGIFLKYFIYEYIKAVAVLFLLCSVASIIQNCHSFAAQLLTVGTIFFLFC